MYASTKLSKIGTKIVTLDMRLFPPTLQVAGDMLFSHNFDICQVLDYFKLKVLHVVMLSRDVTDNILKLL